jgi:hypothetical protein
MFYTETQQVGKTTLYTHTWGTRGWARKVDTAWGERTVELTGEPDTYFSRPARLQLSHNGKRYNVPGFLTVKTVDGLDSGEVIGLEFHGYTSNVQELPAELLKGK